MKKLDTTTVPSLFPWAGGKKWLGPELRTSLDQIIHDGIRAYCEPLCGALGSLRSVANTLISHGIKKVVLNDCNHNLINLYEHVQSRPDELIAAIKDIETQFALTIPEAMLGKKKVKANQAEKFGMLEANEFYKAVRTELNQRKGCALSRAAKFFWMMNHCFNGEYREGPNGNNIGFNWTPKPMSAEIIEARIKANSELFRQFEITFTCGSYADIEYNISTVYYLDPPYVKSKTVKSKAISYSHQSFTRADQHELIRLVSKTTFIYSNNDAEEIRDALSTISNITITEHARSNHISSNVADRGTKQIEL
jgi:DNA adenine methylase